MQLKTTYIPFESIFPNLVGYLSSKEEFSHHFPHIDQSTPYGTAQKGTAGLERSIKNIHLIMHRIRINSGVNLLPKEKYQIQFLYIPIDFECFFVWLRKIMDQIAYLTPLFYERRNIVPFNSFNDQYKWYVETNPNFDKEYSQYLNNEMSWFTKVRDVRDDSIHRHFWLYAEKNNQNETILKRMRGNKLVQEILSISKEIGELYIKFTIFSKFYENHFSKILKSRDYNFSLKKSKSLLVLEYSASINYFLQKAEYHT